MRVYLKFASKPPKNFRSLLLKKLAEMSENLAISPDLTIRYKNLSVTLLIRDLGIDIVTLKDDNAHFGFALLVANTLSQLVGIFEDNPMLKLPKGYDLSLISSERR